jgi:protein phosphatase methylesterase 1
VQTPTSHTDALWSGARRRTLPDGLVTYECGCELSAANVVFFMLHGAGMSAHSFALLSEALVANNANACTVAFDFRLHGASQYRGVDGDESDVSLQRLCSDANRVLSSMLEPIVDRAVQLVLIGHSLGGAVVTRMAGPASDLNLSFQHARHQLAALVVIDIVEGTAIDALPAMAAVLDKRPVSFPSLDDAVRWAVDTGVPRNEQSARISVPPQLVADATDGSYRWRTPLRQTTVHWPGWFADMSACFLAARCPRLLLLAGDSDSRPGGAERLDSALTAAHMQGRFQLEIMRGSGHALHEDRPGAVAGHIAAFLLRLSTASSRGALLEAANAKLRAQKAEQARD